MTTSAEDRFWELAAPLMGDGAVTRSTMMGYPCLRYRGRFFASIDRTTGALLVKLPQDRVAQAIRQGHGRAFAPAGRTFREWVAVPATQARRWDALMREALAFAQAAG